MMWQVSLILLLIGLPYNVVCNQQLAGPNGWTTTNDVELQSKIALDTKAMREGATETAKKSSYISRDNSDKSLQQLALDASEIMKNDAFYNIYVNGFTEIGFKYEKDPYGTFDEKPATQYADAVVLDLLEINQISKKEISDEAVVIMNVFMTVVHYLSETVETCWKKQNEPSNDSGLKNLDLAMAYYIGSDQQFGGTGSLFYHLAQDAGNRFNQANPDGQTKTNANMINFATQIKNLTIDTGECATKPLETYDLNYKLTQQMIQQMYVVIIQELIHQIKIESNMSIELFALALAPQIAACNPSEFDWLMLNLVDNYQPENFNLVIARLQNLYSCFGVTCDDVGAYQGGFIPKCEDENLLPSKELVDMYNPISQINDVRQYLKMDRDILRMHILCRREAWYQARILYMEGYNGLAVGSNTGWKALEDLEEEEIDYPSLPAQSFIPKFMMYHGGNETYKEDLVMRGLLGTSWFSTVTPIARAEGTKRLFQAIFVPMHALELFYKARSTCTGDDTKNQAIEYWDRGASLLVGSIEGSEPDGNINGTSWYSMSKEFCKFFGTCNDGTSNAKENGEMMTLLVEGLQDLVDTCDIPLSKMESIESTLLIPLVQGTLHFAVVNSDSIKSQESLGAGYVFALSILPLIKAGNAASERYISDWTESPQQNKYRQVFEALARSWNAFNVDCIKIGAHIHTKATLGSFCDLINSLDVPSPTLTPTPGPLPPPTGGPSETDPAFLAGRKGWISLTDVSKEANLALDRKGMIEDKSNVDRIGELYRNGLSNSEVTFQNLSLQSAPGYSYVYDHFYTIYVNAFTTLGYKYESSPYGLFDGKPAKFYANTTVNDLLTISKNEQAIDAMLIMNTFMSITNQLTLALKDCRAFIPGTLNDSGMNHLDKAMALYIGNHQNFGDNFDGFMLYHMAETAGERFNQDNAQTKVNEDILLLAKTISGKIWVTDMCKLDPIAAYDLYWSCSQQIVQRMYVIFIQKLIHYIHNYDKEYIELFSLALIPTISACNPSEYDWFVSNAVTGYDESKKNEVLEHLQGVYSCFGVTCADIGDYKAGIFPQCSDDLVQNKTLVDSYVPSTDAREYLKLDRDVLRIHILCRGGAWYEAENIFTEGYNGLEVGKNTGWVTLQDLDNQKSSISSSLETLFVDFYGNQTYKGDMVKQALEGKDWYAGVSSDTRAESTKRILQTIFVPMYALEMFHKAMESCSDEKDFDTIKFWDRGASLLVGSIEGSKGGGSINGTSWYSMSKEFCGSFGTCVENSSSASANIKMMRLIKTGQQSILEGVCSGLISIVDDIESTLLIPLVQGTLHFASINGGVSGQKTDVSLGAGYAFARSISPVVFSFNRDSEYDISSWTKDPQPNSGVIVTNAIARSWPGFGLDCESIGSIHGKSFCSFVNENSDGGDPDEPPAPPNDEDFSGFILAPPDGWRLSTNVISESQISSAAKKMEIVDDLTERKSIYTKGTIPGKPSLSQLSLQAGELYKSDSFYNIYVDAFNVIGNKYENEEYGLFDKKPTTQYADTVVNDLFDLERKGIEKEAAVIMNVFMTVLHYLSEVVETCWRYQNIPNDSGLHNLDLAMAYYIGDDEAYGDNFGGTLLYNVAEMAGERFGQDNVQTKTNSKILELAKKIKNEVIDAKLCQDKETQTSSYDINFRYTQQIIQQMYVVLIQEFIHQLKEKDRDFIELYALALVPPIAACNPSEFDYFMNNFILSNYEESKFDESLLHLQNVFSCFGVTCADVGEYKGGNIPQCLDVATPKLVGVYTPLNDVEKYFKLDRDVLRMHILCRREAWYQAEILYMEGFNGLAVGSNTGWYSLQDLEEEDFDYSIIPAESFLPKFVSYYNNSKKYKEDLVRKVLYGNDWYSSVSNATRAESTKRLLQAIFLPMHALELFHKARNICSSDKLKAMESWDRGASLLVGSIEGSQVGGTINGTSWYSMSKEFCSFFGTCNDGSSNAKANGRMMTLLQEGTVPLNEGVCNNLGTIVENIESTLLIPLVQGTLHFAVLNGGPSEFRSYESLGAGYALARSILPLLKSGNEAMATVVNDWTSNPSVSEGSHNVVWNAIARTWESFGVNCQDIGEYNGTSFCQVVDSCSSNGCADPVLDDESTGKWNIDNGIGSPESSKDEDDGSDADTTIGLSRYQFSNSIIEFAKISLDLRDISKSDAISGRGIYESGKNSKKDATGTISLKSLTSPVLLGLELYFNIYRYALADNQVQFGMEAASSFGDDYAYTIVSEAFDVGDVDLAHHAIVSTTIYMHILHLLSSAEDFCENKDIPKIELNIDKAVAFYVGVHQTPFKNDGYSFYSTAETAGFRFGTVNSQTTESMVNEQIIDLFKKAKSQSTQCVSELSYDLRQTFQSIKSLMNVVLMQNLIFFISQQENHKIELRNFLELYAFAVLPQVATCNPSLYDFFVDNLYNYQSGSDSISFVKKLQMAYDCLGITCDDVGTLDDRFLGKSQIPNDCTLSSNERSVGYSLKNTFDSFHRIDRDILKIVALDFFDSDRKALLLYKNGFSSHLDIAFNTFEKLVVDNEGGDSIIDGEPLNRYFVEFKKYHGDDGKYSEKLVAEALQGKGIFFGEPKPLISEVIFRTLQTHILLMSGLHSMHVAVQKCQGNDPVASHASWDKSVGLLIGSTQSVSDTNIDTIISNRKPASSIHGLALEMCGIFDTCSPSGNAKINEHLFELYHKGNNYVEAKNCVELAKHIRERIVPSLFVPLVQGTIHYASLVENGDVSSQDEARGGAFALAQSIVPFVKNETLADQISNLNALSKITPRNAESVLTSFAHALPEMKIDCKDIGTIKGLVVNDLCLDEKTSTTETSLSDGLYITTTFVEDRAKIDLDVRDMIKALREDSSDLAKRIYIDGFHSTIYNSDGESTKKLRSLAKFSTSSPDVMKNDPTFNIFRYALGDTNGNYLGQNVGMYGDTIVNSYLNEAVSASQLDKTLAAEAAVSLNVWGYIVHELHETVENCKNQKLRDDDGVHSIDEAVAYWIGSGQQTGSGEKGHLMYALTERMAEKFGQDVNGQAKANYSILRLFKQAAIQLALPSACVANVDTTVKGLRSVINKLISKMLIPQIQGLIASLKQNDKPRARIFSHAFVPFTAACNKSTFEFLKLKLITGQFNVVEVDEIIRRIESTYSCLDLTCDDIGKFKFDTVFTCKNKSRTSQLGGYFPIADVGEISEMDLDILEIEVLLQMGAYAAAKDIYVYGKHVDNGESGSFSKLSLYQLATSTKRQIVPNYETFTQYFSNDNNYADTLIQTSFQNLISESNKNEDQVELNIELILKCARYMVPFMSILQYLYEAVHNCRDKRNNDADNKWDSAVALFVGSMEDTYGTLASNNGYFLYGLANELCPIFNVCDDRIAKVNEDIKTLFYAGSSEILSSSCDALEKTVITIEAKLMISLIQGSLHIAAKNSPEGAFDGPTFTVDSRATGHIYSRSVLPYIKKVDTQADDTIAKNLDYQNLPQPVHDGYVVVFQAFENAVNKLPGVSCRLIGYISKLNNLSVCTGGYAILSGTSDAEVMAIRRIYHIVVFVFTLSFVTL